MRAIATWALRVGMLLVALHVGRVTHSLMDLLIVTSVVAVDDDDCESRNDDTDCPPGCPNCHCVHAAVSPLPPRPMAAFVPREPRSTTIESVPYEAGAPRAPSLDSPFRPPRSTTHSA